MDTVNNLFLYEEGCLIIDDTYLEVRHEEMISLLVGLSFYGRWANLDSYIAAEIKIACTKAESSRDLLKRLEAYTNCEILSTPKFCIFGFNDTGRYHLVICEKQIIGYKATFVEIPGEYAQQTTATIISATITLLSKFL